MVVRTSKTATSRTRTPAKKTAAAPAKKAAPKPQEAPKRAAAPKVEVVTAHDVLRAEMAALKAAGEHARLRNLYWDQNQQDLNAAVAHAERVTEELTPRKKDGPKPADTPSRRAHAKNPVVDEFYDRDKVEGYGLRDLRDLAAELAEKGLITETKVKKTILEQMEEAGLFRAEGHSGSDEDDELDDDEDLAEDEDDEDFEDDEDSDEDDDDAEDDEDDADDDDAGDGDDEEGYTLAELKAMNLTDLQDIAEQNGVDWDDLSKSELIAALIGADDDESDDEEDDEDEDEFLEINPEDIPNMSLKELLELAEEIGLKVPVKKRKDKDYLVEAILEQVDDEDDEE